MVHQIYIPFEDNIPLDKIPQYKNQVEKTVKDCQRLGLTYKMWGYLDCLELLDQLPNKKYKTAWLNMRHDIQRVDFIRYVILYIYGGLYIDCDVSPIICKNFVKLFKRDNIFVRWNLDKKKLPYNAVLGGNAGDNLWLEIMDHSIESYIEKSKQEIYKKWKGRFVFQTTGHYMLQRVLKRKNIVPLDILKIHTKQKKIESAPEPLFMDLNASIWYKNI